MVTLFAQAAVPCEACPWDGGAHGVLCQGRCLEQN